MKNTMLLLIVSFAFLQCKSSDPGLGCTEEFRVIGVEVSGDQLTDYYTVRLGTRESFKVEGVQIGENSTWYPVLDDSYKDQILNLEETFNFIGLIDGIQVLQGEYVITANECHIALISEEINVLVD